MAQTTTIRTKTKGPDMLNDPPGRALLIFALPIILGNLFQQFYNMADGIVVSRFTGENALAAIGTTTALTNVFIAVAIGGSVASSVAFDTALAYLRFIGFFFVFIGLKTSADGVLRGSGDTIVFACANLLNLAIRVWFAYTFSPSLGIAAVWYAVPIGWFVNYLISFLWYLTGKWMKNRAI